MILTIFTDASYCHHNSLGTYAMWAKCEGVTFRYAGVLKGKSPCNNYAEAAALANGVHLAVKYFAPPGRSKIIAQSDSMLAIEILGGKFPKSEKYQDIYRHIRDVLHDNRLTIEYRHVKGHKGRKDRRSAVNTWCHKQCITLLRAEREKIFGK